jgi:ABC-2 type transport system ATP-binding protein
MIEVDRLTKRYGRQLAVDDVSFRCAPGTVTGFLGPNGAGKSTTLRMICGLTQPTAGSATVLGSPYAALPNPGREVGVLLDASAQHQGRTGREVLRLSATVLGVDRARVAELLDLVGLPRSAARKRVGSYSLGMRQRLGIAHALLGNPKVLILDEPANGLDPEGIAWLREFLKGFARQGRTVLVSSHLLAEVEQGVDHLVVIDAGRCVFQGGLEQLRGTGPARVLVRCPDPVRLAQALAAAGVVEIDTLPDGRLGVGGVDAARVGDVALAAGVAVHGLVEERVDLEQMFLQLVSGVRR